MTDLEDYVGEQGPDYGEIERIGGLAGVLTTTMYHCEDPSGYFFKTASDLMPGKISNVDLYVDSLLDYWLDSKKYYLGEAHKAIVLWDEMEPLSYRDTFEYMIQLASGWPFRKRKATMVGY